MFPWVVALGLESQMTHTGKMLRVRLKDGPRLITTAGVNFSLSLVLALAMLAVVSCDRESSPADTATTPSASPPAFRNVRDVVLALNKAGVACSQGPARSQKITSVDKAGTCRFQHPPPWLILISNHARRIYQHHFSGALGPDTYVLGPNWILDIPLGAPENTYSKVKTLLGN